MAPAAILSHQLAIWKGYSFPPSLAFLPPEALGPSWASTPAELNCSRQTLLPSNSQDLDCVNIPLSTLLLVPGANFASHTVVVVVVAAAPSLICATETNHVMPVCAYTHSFDIYPYLTSLLPPPSLLWLNLPRQFALESRPTKRSPRPCSLTFPSRSN